MARKLTKPEDREFAEALLENEQANLGGSSPVESNFAINSGAEVASSAELLDLLERQLGRPLRF